MKKTTLASILLITLTMAACRKTEMPVADSQSAAQYRKTAATQNTATTSYSGQATGVNATVFNTQSSTVTSTQTILSQTSALPSAGGSGQASLLQASISGVLTADSLGATTTGQSDTSRSTASVSNLNLTVAGHVITANLLVAKANAACGPVLFGSSQIVNLVVNGSSITVTGLPNQTVYLPSGGFIIINEQSTSKKAGTINVTALHVIVPNAADIRLASAVAGIKC